MYVAPEDKCDGRDKRVLEEYEYGSAIVNAKVLDKVTIFAEGTELTDVPLGLATRLSGPAASNPRAHCGDGFIGLTPLSLRDFMDEADMEDTTQVLFDGRRGRLVFGEFDAGVQWMKVEQLGPDTDAWTVKAESTSVGSVLFDTAAEGIYLRESAVEEYFDEEEWPQDSFRFVDDEYYISCDLLNQPNVEVPVLTIELDVDIGEDMTETVPFDIDPKWLIGPHTSKADVGRQKILRFAAPNIG